MIEQSKLIAGARVEWTSQAGGVTAKKRGKLIAFVPRNSALPTAFLSKEHRVHGKNRSHIDRYLILLEDKSIESRPISKGSKKDHYYVPVASVVCNGTLIAEAEEQASAAVAEPAVEIAPSSEIVQPSGADPASEVAAS